MAQVFRRKKFSSYLGEQRAIDDIVMMFTSDLGPTPSPTPTPITPTPTASPVSPTPTPTPSITPSSTPQSTSTPTPTRTPQVTSTPTSTSTPQPTSTPTSTSTPTNTPTSSPVPLIEYHLQTEGGDNILTENGDYIDIEYAAPSPTPTPTPTSSSWTPASLSNLWDWWTASSGVGLSGSMVLDWTGYNGNKLVPFNGSFMANFNTSDANFNNQNSITINPSFVGTDCGYYVPLDGVAKTGTVIMVGYINQKYTADFTCLWSNSMPSIRYTMFTEGGGDRYLSYNSQGTPQSTLTGSNCLDGQYMFLRGDYNYTAGDSNFYQSNTNTFTNNISTISVPYGNNYNLANLTLGSYTGVYGQTSTFTVVEFIKLDGIPTNTEMAQLSSYINQKYNL